MLVVIAFCSKDAELQRKNLEWALELDAGCGREGVLSYDILTPKDHVNAIDVLAQKYFTKVHHCMYYEPPVRGWPAACNWAWQSTARWMHDKQFKQPWLWLEADAVPLKSGWVLTLEEEFIKGGKNFGGHIVKDMWHMNGVGIYPWDVMRRNEMAMLARAAAWDVVLKPSTADDCVKLNHLIQHAWNVHPIDRTMIWNGEGTPLSFKSKEDLDTYLDYNAVLIHRVKDGSLIPFLREKINAEQERQRLIMSTEYNVPQHTNREEAASKVEISAIRDVAVEKQGDVAKRQVVGQTHILIVTYWKDRPWLEFCLKALKKYCKGFSGITVAIPRKDFASFASIKYDYGATIQVYDEIRGKGMLQHMAKMAKADELVPAGTGFVCHLDSDCIYHTDTVPENYFTGGKPDYLIRSWESLTDPASKVVSDCHQWRKPTTDQLGFVPPVYSMCRHPTILPIAFYKAYRNHVAGVHGMDFEEYMLQGKNEFPQDRMDWTAMGAFAYATMHDQFNWMDIGKQNAFVPADRQKTFWSHAGVQPDTKKQMEGFLA